MKILLPLLCAVGVQSYSQAHLSSPESRNSTEDRNRFEVAVKKDKSFTEAYTNNIPAAVFADFIERYENPGAVSWIVDGNHITARFTRENEYIILWYNRNGSLLYTRKNYDSSKLDPDIGRFVRELIPHSYNFNLVTEIIKEKGTIYEISLVDARSTCILKVHKDMKTENMEVVDKKILSNE